LEIVDVGFVGVLENGLEGGEGLRVGLVALDKLTVGRLQLVHVFLVFLVLQRAHNEFLQEILAVGDLHLVFLNQQFLVFVLLFDLLHFVFVVYYVVFRLLHDLHEFVGLVHFDAEFGVHAFVDLLAEFFGVLHEEIAVLFGVEFVAQVEVDGLLDDLLLVRLVVAELVFHFELVVAVHLHREADRVPRRGTLVQFAFAPFVQTPALLLPAPVRIMDRIF